MDRYIRTFGSHFTINSDDESKIVLKHINENILRDMSMTARSIILNGNRITHVAVVSDLTKEVMILKVGGYYPCMKLFRDNVAIGDTSAAFDNPPTKSFSNQISVHSKAADMPLKTNEKAVEEPIVDNPEPIIEPVETKPVEAPVIEEPKVEEIEKEPEHVEESVEVNEPAPEEEPAPVEEAVPAEEPVEEPHKRGRRKRTTEAE